MDEFWEKRAAEFWEKRVDEAVKKWKKRVFSMKITKFDVKPYVCMYCERIYFTPMSLTECHNKCKEKHDKEQFIADCEHRLSFSVSNVRCDGNVTIHVTCSVCDFHEVEEVQMYNISQESIKMLWEKNEYP